MELLKLLNTNELVAQIVCFLVLLAILRVFLWKNFLGILDRRKEAVLSEFRDIEKKKASLSDLQGEYEKRIAEIDIEANERIQKAIAEGRRLTAEMLARAEKDGDRLLDNAKANIKDELARAREDLKDAIVSLTIQVAEKVVQEKLSEESDRRIVEGFIEEIGKK